MKLFFTVFGAILAAAAVIWGVFSYRENQTKNKQATLDSLKQSIRLAEKYHELLLLQGGEIDPARARHTVFLLESFASVIKRDLPDEATRGVWPCFVSRAACPARRGGGGRGWDSLFLGNRFWS
jgi:hypothetical protein